MFLHLPSYLNSQLQTNVKHSYGFEPNEDNTDSKSFEYYKVFFNTKRSWNIIARKDNKSEISEKAHEKNVDCITRFFNESNISPPWIVVKGENIYKKVSTSKIEVECNMENIEKYTKSGFAPIRIGYWDLETLGLEHDLPICTIGLTVRTYGGEREKYVLQVGKTDDIEGRTVYSLLNEYELISKFRDLIVELDLDALVTYNGTNFDELFIINTG